MNLPNELPNELLTQMKSEFERALERLSKRNDTTPGDDDPLESSMLDLERARVPEICQALNRLAADEYGVCEDCRNPIGKERLLALPFADLCINCKRTSERYERYVS